MSDSTNSSFSFLSNWKLCLAVCVPCFAVGLGVTYYYYAKTPDKNSQKEGNVNDKENNVSQNLPTTNGFNQNNINDFKKVQTVTKKVKVLKKQGKVEFLKKNFDAAITFYTHALSMCPESKEVLLSGLYQNRAAAYSKLNNNENCVADCDKALTLVPTYKKALSLRSRALVQLENYKLALEDITAVVLLDESKNKTDVIFSNFVMTILCNLNMEEYTKNNIFNLPSKTFIDNYMKSFYNDPFNDKFPQTLIKSDVNTGLELALKNLKDKNYEMIEDACKEELNKSDNSLIRRMWALNLLATFFILRGNYEDGINHLTTIIETPKLPNMLVISSLIKRGSVYHQQVKGDKFSEDFKQAEKIDPNCFEISYHRAQLYLLDMNGKKAVEYFGRAFKLNPQFILSNVQCCYAQYLYAKKSSNELGVEKYLRLLRGFVIKYPDNAESYRLCAKALSDEEAYEEADSLFKKVHELYPENATFLVDRALVVLSWKSSVSKAFEFLEQAIKLDPKCDYAYETLGTLCIQIGKLKEAIDYLNKAVTLCKPEKGIFHLFALRNKAQAHLGIIERFGITPDQSIDFSDYF